MNAVLKPLAAETVRAAWGEEAPDWVVILAEECDRTSQKAAAQQINYSPAVVSTVLKGTYKGDLTAVERPCAAR